MNLEQIIKQFEDHPYKLQMGAGKLAKWFKCDKKLIYEAKERIRNKVNIPKILILDVETSPCKSYIWQSQVWKANISHDKIISQWFILTIAAKWLHEDDTMSDRLTSVEVKNENDERLVKKLWNLLNEADIVIAHNGKRFDIPNVNTRFLLYGMYPTTYYKIIDTLEVARSQFGFTHNNLNALSETLGLGSKIHTEFDLWVRCLNGDTQALKEMETYNRQDVELLEVVYLELRPWIKSHVNLNLYVDSVEKACPHCLSTNLTQEGYYFTQTGKYPTHRCADCGSIVRERKTIINRKKDLLVSIPGR